MNDSNINNFLMQIDLFSHGFKISNFTQEIKQIIYRFSFKFAEYEFKKEFDVVRRCYLSKKVIARIYGGSNKERNEFYFHINVLNDFLNTCGVNEKRIKIVKHELYSPEPIDLVSISDKQVRDYQIPFIDYIIEPGKTKIINLQTGKGKTFIFSKAMETIKERTAIVIKSMYIDKWIKDLTSHFDLTQDDIVVIKGSSNLVSLIQMGLRNELKTKFIIISNSTYRNFIESFCNDQFHLNNYLITPYDFWKVLKVGVRLVDEGHMDLHFNFKMDLFSHIPKTITLSATLDSDSSFINKMIRIMFPNLSSAPKIEDDRYIIVKTILYNMRNLKNIRYKNVFNQYNHIKFEQSIIRDLKKLKNYIRMIEDITENYFVNKKQDDQKFLIFCATIELCTIVTESLKDKFPNLVIKRKVGEDDLNDLLTADIAVSTLKSAGTAFDIPNLFACLCTVAVSGKQINQQAIGRLRKLTNYPSLKPEFIFLACNQIKKHIDYVNEKEFKISNKILSYNILNSSYEI